MSRELNHEVGIWLEGKTDRSIICICLDIGIAMRSSRVLHARLDGVIGSLLNDVTERRSAALDHENLDTASTQVMAAGCQTLGGTCPCFRKEKRKAKFRDRRQTR